MAPQCQLQHSVDDAGDHPSLVSKSQDSVVCTGLREKPSGSASDDGGGGESVPRRRTVAVCSVLLPWAGALVWPLLLTVPLLLSSPYSFTSYESLFAADRYEYDPLAASGGDRWPKPLGLCLGISAVAVGQVFVLLYFFLHSQGHLGAKVEPFERPEEGRDEGNLDDAARKVTPPPIQIKGAPRYRYLEGVRTHLSQPEGFVLLALYLSGTWMLRLMPPTYYKFEGSVQWWRLAACLICQDGIQYVMHRLEHGVSPAFYRMSHKPHHRFTNPRLFDAFNGSLADTIIMILIPLYLTALTVGCNVWTYMAFGSTYANWLTLIHSEYPLPWDRCFRRLGLGTPGDHHVHHKFFKYNYGHLFMWFDRVGGTYQNPEDHPRVFSPQA